MTSIVDKIISPIDRVRSKVAAKVGHRPWTVRLVWAEWSGGSRGVGTESVVSSIELNPPPRIDGSADLGLQATGLQEQGTLELSEISLAIDEDKLTGGLLGEQQSFYYEIDFGDGQWRRYVPAGQPIKDIEGSFGWRIVIKRCEGCQ